MNETFVVIGNGAIALSICTEMLNKGIENICLVAPIDEKSTTNMLSASRAAGAMLNIGSEIDFFYNSSEQSNYKLKNAQKALNAWKVQANRLEAAEIVRESNTYVYTRKGLENELEEKSFENQRNVARTYGLNIKTSVGRHKHINSDEQTEYNIFPDEPIIDTPLFFRKHKEHTHRRIKYLDDHATSIQCIEEGTDRYEVRTINGSIKASHVVVCAGVWSENIIKNSIFGNKPKLRVFKGVGSALKLKKELNYIESHPRLDILRSPNRGGTCGIHTVERSNDLYVGASSFITDKNIRLARQSSIFTMLESLKKEINVDLERYSLELVTGYRPVSSDTHPLIGKIHDGIYCCYGTKRDGLTWAPYYAEKIVGNITGLNNNDQIFDLFDPLREPLPYKSFEEGLTDYLFNREFEARQHNGQYHKEIEIKKYEMAHLQNKEFKSIHPELVSIGSHMELTW